MKNINSLSFVLLLLSFYSCFAQKNHEELFNYSLKFSADDLRIVEVTAEMTIQEPYLEMNPWGIPPEIEKGWAEFVEKIFITDKDDKPIQFKWNQTFKRWDLKTTKNSKVKVYYQVKLNHDNYNWDAGGGIDGRPTIWDEESIFWVTKGLFIYCYGDDSSKKAQVTIVAPNNWNISTSWVETKRRTYKIKNLDELDNNLIVLGKHLEQNIKIDNMIITLAIPRNFTHRAALLRKSLENILPYYKSVFGELPTANYLICASKNNIEDGEAYRNSFHQMFTDDDLEHRKIVWANIFAHEMFHYWNGTNFIYSNEHDENYWFSEGFTEYYSSLALVTTGIISEEDFLKKLSYQFSRFHTSQKFNIDELTLVNAGKEKIKNWHLLYGGGATMAFVIDIEMRVRTKGKKTLNDFMRTLYMDYGKKGKPVNLQVQIKALNDLTNTDFKPLFDKYITGNSSAVELILRSCKKAGLVVAHYQSEFYLTPKKEPKSIYKEITKKQNF